MNLTSTPSTVAAGGVMAPVIVGLCLVVAVAAFVLFKNRGKAQARDEAGDIGRSLGLTPFTDGAEALPATELTAALKTLSHGRSHRFVHPMRSGGESGPAYVFELGYDSGILHAPDRWSYVVAVFARTDATQRFLVLSESGPQDLAEELGYRDTTWAGRTLRAQDLTSAEARLSDPVVASVVADHPGLVLEYGGGFLAVLTPGQWVGDDAIDHAAFLELARELAAGVRSRATP